jgi:hypothetical protein
VKGDQVLERVADKARATAERLAREDGMKAKLAEPLAEDAEFLRKLKPSLIKARAKGEAPTDEKPAAQPPVRESGPGEGVWGNREVPPARTGRAAPNGPQLGKRPRPKRAGGPNPFVVAGAALVVGVFLAKWLDWRGHAHPRG